MDKKRIVITGLGIVSPIGTGVDTFWDAAVKGTNGVLPLEMLDTTDYKTKTGGEVRDFDAEKYLSAEEIKHMGRASQFAVAATQMAIKDSGLDINKENPFRVGVSVGTTMGEPQILETCVKEMYEKESQNAFPAHLPRQYPCNTIPTNIARVSGAKGPVMIIPTACAAGNYAIGYAYDMLQLGQIDVAVVGGSDPFSGIAFTGFNRLLATTESVVSPFDKNRKGMGVSEGAGILIIETLEHAQARGAEIHAEILGYGLGCDAHKMTIPDPEGRGGILALQRALKNADIKPEDVDYVNAHGTGTKENDRTETNIVKAVLGQNPRICMSSTKSMTGHTMGAASAIEASACVLMLKNNIMLPTINYNEPDPECDIDCVPNKAREAELNIVVSNAYAFAGNCSALVLGKFKG